MSSSKVFLCDLCIIMIIGLHFVVAQSPVASPSSDDGPKGNCSCGGFPTDKPEAGAAPTLSQMPGLEVKIDGEGLNTCKTLCLALGTATKAKGPEILCNKLKMADELKLSAFYKVGDNPWTYAGMTAEEPLCCDNSKVIVCASVLAAGNGTDASIPAAATFKNIVP